MNPKMSPQDVIKSAERYADGCHCKYSAPHVCNLCTLRAAVEYVKAYEAMQGFAIAVGLAGEVKLK